MKILAIVALASLASLPAHAGPSSKQIKKAMCEAMTSDDRAGALHSIECMKYLEMEKTAEGYRISQPICENLIWLTVSYSARSGGIQVTSAPLGNDPWACD